MTAAAHLRAVDVIADGVSVSELRFRCLSFLAEQEVDNFLAPSGLPPPLMIDAPPISAPYPGEDHLNRLFRHQCINSVVLPVMPAMSSPRATRVIGPGHIGVYCATDLSYFFSQSKP